MSHVFPTIAQVLLDESAPHLLDYTIPFSMQEKAQIGIRVEVPFRKTKKKGVIFNLKNGTHIASIRPIEALLFDEPSLPADLLQTILWISNYYATSLAQVFKIALPSVVRSFGHEKKQQTHLFFSPLVSMEKLRATCLSLRSSFPAQAKVLDLFLSTPDGLFLSEILEKAGVSQSPITTLCSKNILKKEEKTHQNSPLMRFEFFPTLPKKLSFAQQQTLDEILSSLSRFVPHLIHGVTGSGKTEVYLQAMEAVLNRKESVIYLIPEIALTSQTIERIKGRFGDQHLALFHHRLSDTERSEMWYKVQKGTGRIIVGARSAIFCPTPRLGLIIVDEEHDASYKQSEEAPKYHARDVAVMRAKYRGCPIILGTATPSLESYYNAKKGKYKLHLLNQRPSQSQLPQIEIIDMRPADEKAKGFTLFSDSLIEALKKTLEKKEQSLLLLNRRGYHTSAECPHCSSALTCPHCDLKLTYHKANHELSCHLCDFTLIPPSFCPQCGKEGLLKFKGIGTELVESRLQMLFPSMRILRVDADTTKRKGSHEQFFQKFRSGKADLLIGTQMIAKGLHFPLVTLVAILNIDSSLNIPDFRAAETTFQLLTQVAGRSGRGELPGRVLIQTHMPTHPLIKETAEGNFKGFYEEELQVRNTFGFPPFTHLIKFSISGSDATICEKQGFALREHLLTLITKETEIYPCVPCGYTKIKGKYRYQCLLKTKSIKETLILLRPLSSLLGKKKEVTISMDVDPVSTFF